MMGAGAAAFPTRVMPSGTQHNANTTFNRSMAAQAARVPRLANIVSASNAIRGAKGPAARSGRKR